MKIKFSCACGEDYEVSDILAGKTVRCKNCQQPVRVPAAAPMQSQSLPEVDPLFQHTAAAARKPTQYSPAAQKLKAEH